MKKYIMIFSLSFGFSLSVTAQEDIEQLQQQPPPVTERQVERDAKKAAEQQSSNQNDKKKPVAKNADMDRKNDTISKKRASRKPGKQ